MVYGIRTWSHRTFHFRLASVYKHRPIPRKNDIHLRYLPYLRFGLDHPGFAILDVHSKYQLMKTFLQWCLWMLISADLNVYHRH
jgi:hypothetical protein